MIAVVHDVVVVIVVLLLRRFALVPSIFVFFSSAMRFSLLLYSRFQILSLFCSNKIFRFISTPAKLVTAIINKNLNIALNFSRFFCLSSFIGLVVFASTCFCIIMLSFSGIELNICRMEDFLLCPCIYAHPHTPDHPAATGIRGNKFRDCA